MNKIIIGSSEHKLCDVTENWIVHHVHERHEHGQAVCAQIILKTSSIDMVLSTPQCARGFVGGRHPNHKEEEILHLWHRANLNDPHWKVEHLISFVKQVKHHVCR